MIIKSLSRKEPSFSQLTAYMLAEDGAAVDLTHNLPIGAQSPAEIVQAFTQNHALLPVRANGNALYHEIIALPPNAEVPRTRQIAALRELAARYLQARAPQQLAVGVIHAETAHIHLHLMISSNAVLSRQRLRLPKKDFAALQRELEDYRLAHFPELGSSRHYNEAREGARQSSREQAVKLRNGKASHKEDLAATLTELFHRTRSREGLETALAKHDLTLYRRGRSVGVVTEGGRRYRLATLGLGLGEAYAEAMARVELVESRVTSLKRSTMGHIRERER